MSGVIRRVLALLTGVTVALALALSPLGHGFALQAADWTVGTREQVSIRELNYSNGVRENATQQYQQVIADTPAGVDNLFVMGSSDFYVDIPQAPSHWLPGSINDFDMFLSGRGGHQSLAHAIELASVASALNRPKVVLMLSPQWFVKGGVSAGQFGSLFSYDSWYAMLDNPGLSAATRQRLIDRAATLMPGLCNTRARCSGTPLIWHGLTTPYSLVAERLQLIREAHQTATADTPDYSLSWSATPDSRSISTVDWVAADAAAREYGASRSTSNNFGIDDTIWETYFADRIDGFAGRQARDHYTESVEYEDLQLFLDVARELGVQVMLVAQPVNGAWSDYTGLSVADREAYANRVRQIAAANGVQLTDLTGKQYEPYYMYDPIHLGWRGWVDVIEACWRFSA